MYQVMNAAITWVSNALAGTLDICFGFLEKLGAVPFIVSVFLVYTLYRFVLSPLFGGAGSDVVNSARKRAINSAFNKRMNRKYGERGRRWKE